MPGHFYTGISFIFGANKIVLPVMKAGFINTLLLFSSLFCLAQPVNFEPSLKMAFEKARQQHKMVFVEYYNAECPVCKKLEPVFADTELGKFYNENFISYKLNTEQIKKEDSLFIQKAGFKFESVPYFLFFDNDQVFVHYSGTKQDITYLINAGKTALEPGERSADLPAKYNSGDRTIKTLYAYSSLIELYKNDSLRTILADELFKAYPKEELGKEKSYIITKNCVNNINNGFFIYWVNHIDEIKTFEKNAKSTHQTNVLGDILQKSVNSNERKGWDLAKIREVKAMILKTAMSKDPDAFFWEQESALLVKEHHNNEALELFKLRIANDSDVISASAYTIDHFLNLFSERQNLDKIKNVIDRLSAKKTGKTEKAGLMYSAILYYKRINDKKTAKKLGADAVSFYTANKIDTGKLNLLLSDR